MATRGIYTKRKTRIYAPEWYGVSTLTSNLISDQQRNQRSSIDRAKSQALNQSYKHHVCIHKNKILLNTASQSHSKNGEERSKSKAKWVSEKERKKGTSKKEKKKKKDTLVTIINEPQTHFIPCNRGLSYIIAR